MRRLPRHEWASLQIVTRAWTPAERRVVVRGFLGRLTISIEPFFLGLFFAFLPIGMLLRRQDIWLFVAPIFGFAALAFVIYAIALMVPCTRALLESFSPIFIVDGYVRYRKVRHAAAAPEFFVAVLNSNEEQLGEWPMREWPESIGEREQWPVLVEFSPYGGIHRIDGRATGVLPTEIAPLGIGIAAAQRARDSGSGGKETG